MSDNWVKIVAKPPGHLPAPSNIQAALATFNELAPEADEIEIIKYPNIQFFDCGANFEIISCPQCQSPIELEWWEAAMESDFEETCGFQLKERTLPCCSAHVSLNKLYYSFHQAFGRFAISAMNPNIGRISSEDIHKFEVALGCKISVVYEHV